MMSHSALKVHYLPLRPHSPADLKSVAMTELQEKQKKRKKYLVILIIKP